MHTDSQLASSHVTDLRDAMISAMRECGFLTQDRVAEAFASVPRHLFTPEVSVEEAYNAFGIVRTQYDETGATLSSVSAPSIQALMLEQAAIRTGHRVLEIGSGGYNAALLAELVGRTGSVATVDIDPEITNRASRLLDATGYGRVTVTCRDAEHGVADYAPYDRIVVTAGTWDIPAAWTHQLAPGGRLVAPLRMRGLTRSVALERNTGHWSSLDYQLCGFVPVRGAGAYNEPRIQLAPGVQLLLDDHQGHLDTPALQTVLAQPAVQHWSGVTVGGNEPFDELYLWLASQLDGFARLSGNEDAIEAGVVDRWTRYNAATLVDGDSLAYLAPIRPIANGNRYEFGVRAHGPDGDRLAATLIHQIQQWDHGPRGHRAHIEVYPAEAPLPQHPATRIVDKAHTRVLLTWPTSPASANLSS